MVGARAQPIVPDMKRAIEARMACRRPMMAARRPQRGVMAALPSK